MPVTRLTEITKKLTKNIVQELYFLGSIKFGCGSTFTWIPFSKKYNPWEK